MTQLAATEPARRGRRGSMGAPALVGLLGPGSVVLLHLRDPHDDGTYGHCPFHFFTGLWCPGCGGLRAINDLTRLDVGAAISSNVLAVCLVAVLGVAFVRWLPRRWRGENGPLIRLSPRWSTTVICVLVVFTVLRNLPPGAWFAP